MRKRETNELRNVGYIVKVDALKLAVDKICVFKKARTHKLLWSPRVWRVCINMILELERDYTTLKEIKYVNEV